MFTKLKESANEYEFQTTSNGVSLYLPKIKSDKIVLDINNTIYVEGSKKSQIIQSIDKKSIEEEISRLGQAFFRR